ncbi:hypothetical protein [Stackebrandtia soli]|uniref:hypothetical protein n=1 Tax=Stackebrandtia soli TaxID=1892856 RepID=UPI0039EC5545
MTNPPSPSAPEGWSPQPPPDPTAAPSPSQALPSPMPQQQPSEVSGPPSAPPGTPTVMPQPVDPALAWQASPPVSGQPFAVYPPGASVPSTPEAPKQSSPVLWMFGIGGVVLLLVLALGLVLWLTNDKPSAPLADESASPTTEQTEQEPESGTPLITDVATGLSYPQLPAPWSVSPNAGSHGFLSAAGQQFLTEEAWAAVCIVGELDAADLGYEGPDSMQPVLEKLAELTDDNNYGTQDGGPLEGLKREGEPTLTEVTIGDHQGLRIDYRLTWTDDAIGDKGETLIIGVVDLGDGRLAGFLASIPDFGADQTEAVTQALEQLQFV